MGFRVNTNVGVMYAHQNGTFNNIKLDKNLEALGSGLRINKAADDAAGMAISSKLSVQSKALGQAIRNANEGIGLIQTADGAMEEMSSIAKRIRVLAVEGANDSQDTESRSHIAKEIKKLYESFQDIRENTRFNGIQILNGTAGAIGTVSSDSYILNGSIVDSTSSVTGGSYVDNGSTVSNASAVTGNSYVVNGSSVSGGSTIGSNSYVDQASVKGTSTVTGNSYVLNGSTVTGGSTIDLNSYVDDGSIVDINSTVTDNSYILNNSTVTGGSVVNTNSYVDNGSVVDGGSTITGNSFLDNSTVIGSVIDGNAHLTNAVVINGVVISGTVFGGTVSASSGAVNASTSSSSHGDFVFHTGAYSNDTISVSIGDTNFATLFQIGGGSGSVNINPITQSDFEGLVKNVDYVLKGIDSKRATLGASQNKLESIVRNISVTQVNVENARSQMMDVDFASESADFSKHNIITQSGSYALSQANATNNNIMALFQ